VARLLSAVSCRAAALDLRNNSTLIMKAAAIAAAVPYFIQLIV
jgi:hypothetical protein